MSDVGIGTGRLQVAQAPRERRPDVTAVDSSDPVVALRGVGKRYGGVYAVRDVDLDLHAGEVHALLGENGAGKSTLVKVLGGVHRASEGTVLLDGAVVDFHSPAQAQAAGISVVH